MRLPRSVAMGPVAFQHSEMGLAGVEGIVSVRHEEVLDARGSLLRGVVVIPEHPYDAMGIQEIRVLRKYVLIHLGQGASFIGVVPESYEKVRVLLLHQVHNIDFGSGPTAEVAGCGEPDAPGIGQAVKVAADDLTARAHRIAVSAARPESVQNGAVKDAVFLQVIPDLGRKVLSTAQAVADGSVGHACGGDPADDNRFGPRLHQIRHAYEDVA